MRIPVALGVVISSLFVFFAPTPAGASVYGDDLAKCLVEKTSDGDKIVLAQWIYTVMSVHPSAASLAKVSDSDRTAVAKRAGAVFETLLADSCRAETAKAVKYEGPEVLKGSFTVLGQIAMTTLLANPSVSAESQNFVKFVDEAKIKAVFEGAAGGD